MIDGKHERLISTQAAVLGCILIEPELCGSIIPQLEDSDFITSEYKHIFQAVKKLFFDGKQVDAVTICHAAGGEAYRKILMDLMDLTPTAAGWQEYVELLKQEARLYQLQKIAGQIMVCPDIDKAAHLLSQAQRFVSMRSNVSITSMQQGFANFLQSLDQKPDYRKTGIGKLDSLLKITDESFLVIGGYPSAGKTALALQIACNLCKEKKIGFFSLETSDERIYNRIISAETMTDFKKIRDKNLSEQELMTILEQKNKFQSQKLEVLGASGMTVSDIIGHTLQRQYDMIFVDYLQLIVPENPKLPRHEQVAQISRDLHRFAQLHKVPVFGLSQLSRPEKQGETQKAPTMASLRESGQLEQDADAIMLLYLSDPANPKGDRRLKLAKNKDGEIGMFPLAFEGRFQHFLEYLDDKSATYRPQQTKIGGIS